MTEVASLLPNNHRLTSVKHYDAGPPENHQLVEPGETYATTKEEEWISKKKTEVLNTKQIETRVKRQVVLEDGKVVEDSGPMVTTNTTEDTETQEHHHTELRKLGDDEVDGRPSGALENGENSFDKSSSNWVSVPNSDGIVREVKEHRVVSREETEEIKETEDVQHLGDITDEEFLAAVKSGKSDIQSLLIRSSEAGKAVVSTGPRVIRDTSKSKKVSDTEDTRELSSVLPNGKIVTETQRTTEHEEVNDDELPENAAEQDYHKESSQRYLKTREQEDVDYLANGRNVGHEMKYKTETMEIEKHGDDEVDLFESLSTRAKNKRMNGKQPQRIRGISEWNERRQEQQHYYNNNYSHQVRHTPSPYSSGQSPYTERPSRSPIPDYHRPQHSPIPDYHRHQYSPIPDYRNNGHSSPSPDYGRPIKITQTPIREFNNDSPTPPQRKNRTVDRKEKFLEKSERRTHYDSGYRSSGRLDDSSREDRVECLEEPPPDYSPPSPPPMPREDRKQYQKTRFAADPPKAKSGNIIGQSIRKLVNKIRSASAERKAKNQRAKRSPSPSYQPGHVIDNNIGNSMDKHQPVQRYYLGEDPFGGSIYGRENKYDGVKPARNSRRNKEDERGDRRSQSTLGRFSKSTSRLVNRTVDEENRVSSQTLPRHLNKFDPVSNSANNNNRLINGNRSNSTINVSIINTVNTPRIINDGPIKPVRTYKSNLSRSKSLIVHGDLLDPIIRNKSTMYTSNSNINRLNNNSSGLKSPGLISSLNRSHRDINNDIYTSRFQRNGDCVMDNNNTRRFPDSNNFGGERITEKKVYVSSDYKNNKSPDYFRTMNGNDEDWRTKSYNNATTYKTSSSRNFNGTDVYEPPTRLRDNHIISASSPSHSILRRGSNSSTDFSETYHTTSRNDDPHRPSVTNTVKTISKKTIPGKHGRGLETIESSEMKSITKSHYRSGNNNNNRSHDPSPSVKFFESERRYDNNSRPVIIEVKRS